MLYFDAFAFQVSDQTISKSGSHNTDVAKPIGDCSRRRLVVIRLTNTGTNRGGWIRRYSRNRDWRLLGARPSGFTSRYI